MDGAGGLIARVSSGCGPMHGSPLWEARGGECSVAGQNGSAGRAESGSHSPGAGGVQTADLETYEREGSPTIVSSRLWDDGILDPMDTRMAIGLGISAALQRANPGNKVRSLSGCDSRGCAMHDEGGKCKRSETGKKRGM